MESSTTRSDNHNDSVNKSVFYLSVTVVIFKHSSSAFIHAFQCLLHASRYCYRPFSESPFTIRHIALNFYCGLQIRLFQNKFFFSRKRRSHFPPKIALFQVIRGKKLPYCENFAGRPNTFREIHFRKLSKTWR
jgi:hypothetical protein